MIFNYENKLLSESQKKKEEVLDTCFYRIQPNKLCR